MSTTTNKQLPPRLVEIKQRYGGTVREADKTYVVQGDDLAWLIAEVELSVSRRAASRTEQAAEICAEMARDNETKAAHERSLYPANYRNPTADSYAAAASNMQKAERRIRALAASPVEDARCAECGHSGWIRSDGVCALIVRPSSANSICGHRCDFSRPVQRIEQKVEQCK